MNQILEFVSKGYAIQIKPNIMDGTIEVVVKDRKNYCAFRSFPMIEADTAGFDLLLCVVEQCVLDLQDLNGEEKQNGFDRRLL